jgi:hypothetical protein
MSRQKMCLVGILLLGLALRLIDLANTSAIEIDGVAYAQIAEHFSNGALRLALKNIFPPFYPLTIALFHLFIPDLELAARLVSLVCGLLLIYGGFVAFRRFFGEKKAAYGAFFIAIHPYLVRYSAQALSESLATLLFASAVFLFYRGRMENNGWGIVLSGFLLALTYLTRPEYIVYYVPFAALLLYRRKLSHTAVLFLPCIILVLTYIVYTRIDTGLWMLARKGLVSSVVPPLTAFKNTPTVAYHFFAALFPPFIVLLILGVKGSERSFLGLMIVLSVFHVASLACVGHSTRRYSVEFVPLLMVFVVEGWYVMRTYVARFRSGVALPCGILVFVTLLAFSQGITGPNEGRELFKKAGTLLLQQDQGAKIAARLPLVSFYAKGEWIDISVWPHGTANCIALSGLLARQGTKYVIFDEEVKKELPSLEDCLARFPVVAGFGDDKRFVKIYRVQSTQRDSSRLTQ